MFHTIFFVPLYNALVELTSVFGGSLGLAVVGLTLIVKLVLSPLSYKSIVSQLEQKKLQPLLDEIKKKYPDQKEQAAKTMELYKEHKTNPFAGCLLIILQLPVIIALYRVFLAGAAINPADLYPFVHAPSAVNMSFLGIDMGAKSVVLAVFAAVSQFLQMHWSPSMKATASSAKPDPENTQAVMAASMTKSMKYTMPVMIGFFGYAVPGAVALYWGVSNVFMIVQEKLIERRMSQDKAK